MWKCKQCGYIRKNDDIGFQLLGNGFVRCPQCGQAHYVPIGGGELIRVEDWVHQRSQITLG